MTIRASDYTLEKLIDLVDRMDLVNRMVDEEKLYQTYSDNNTDNVFVEFLIGKRYNSLRRTKNDV